MDINCSGYRDLNRGRAFGFGPFFVLNLGGCELEPEQLFWFSWQNQPNFFELIYSMNPMV